MTERPLSIGTPSAPTRSHLTPPRRGRGRAERSHLPQPSIPHFPCISQTRLLRTLKGSAYFALACPPEGPQGPERQVAAGASWRNKGKDVERPRFAGVFLILGLGSRDAPSRRGRQRAGRGPASPRRRRPEDLGRAPTAAR